MITMLSTSLFLGLVSQISFSHAHPLSANGLAVRATGEVVENAVLINGSEKVAAAIATAATTTPSVVSYQMLSGSGSQWPSADQWVTFEQMFANNQDVMSSSCSQWKQPENTQEEMNDLSTAITTTSQTTGVDKRFILAIIMQESRGCVRTPTSSGYVQNPGLMQDHSGSASCNTNHVVNGQLVLDGTANVPCTSDQILAMVSEGTAGTTTGDGLANCLNQASALGGTAATAYYWASRIYNTGSYIAGTDLGAPASGTSCYASDIANRLLGWAGAASPCTLPNPW